MPSLVEKVQQFSEEELHLLLLVSGLGTGGSLAVKRARLMRCLERRSTIEGLGLIEEFPSTEDVRETEEETAVQLTGFLFPLAEDTDPAAVEEHLPQQPPCVASTVTTATTTITTSTATVSTVPFYAQRRGPVSGSVPLHLPEVPSQGPSGLPGMQTAAENPWSSLLAGHGDDFPRAVGAPRGAFAPSVWRFAPPPVGRAAAESSALPAPRVPPRPQVFASAEACEMPIAPRVVSPPPRVAPRPSVTERTRVPCTDASASTPVLAHSPLVSIPHASTVVMPYRDIGAIVRRWKITFSGGRNASADEFLRRIEEMRRVTSLTNEEMLRALPVVFSGTALQWYRLYRDAWKSWDDFCADFRLEYADIEFQRRLRDQARTRTQGEGELARDYFTCLRAIFSHFDRPYALQDQLDRAYENLRPEYRREIDRESFASFQELAQLCRKREQVWQACRRYRPPPPPEQSALPELAFRGPSRRTRRDEHVAAVRDSAKTAAPVAAIVPPRKSTTPVTRSEPPRSYSAAVKRNPPRREGKAKSDASSVSSRSSSSRSSTTGSSPSQSSSRSTRSRVSSRTAGSRASTRTSRPSRSTTRTVPSRKGSLETVSSRKSIPSDAECWNCGEKGHYYSQCPRERNHFCYRCGKKSETTRSCPSCSPSKRRARR